MAQTLLSAAVGLAFGLAVGLAFGFALGLLADRANPERVEGSVRVTQTCGKIKRASGFLRTQDARAALPQNCSMGM